MAFRKLVGSYKDYTLSTHVIEAGYLAVDVDTGSLRIGDGVTAGGTEVGGGGASSLGDLSAIGSTMTAPSNADLELVTAGTGNIKLNDISIADNEISTNRSNDNLRLIANGTGAVVIEGLKIQGTTISTDSSADIEITGNLIPSQTGVFQLGSSTRRWQTVYVAAETIDLGGATIKSDGTGNLEIAASGATLPSGSKVGANGISLNGSKAGTLSRPVQTVGLFLSDGSSILTDTQLLATTAPLKLEFNATVEDVPVYTDAGQTFTLANGTALVDSGAAGITLFQF
jgi:hypothetical protein|tara:strand:- start:639 stop:1493 length:855 start_codon:yes stop_codon:yes gene_type:complete